MSSIGRVSTPCQMEPASRRTVEVEQRELRFSSEKEEPPEWQQARHTTRISSFKKLLQPRDDRSRGGEDGSCSSKARSPRKFDERQRSNSRKQAEQAPSVPIKNWCFLEATAQNAIR